MKEFHFPSNILASVFQEPSQFSAGVQAQAMARGVSRPQPAAESPPILPEPQLHVSQKAVELNGF